VIVRISTEGQYELPEGIHDELNEIDNRVVAAVEAHDEPGFKKSFGDLLDFVRERGTPLGDDDLRESQLIIPPADTSIHEAEEFTGEGLLPD
jgi:hypothetical protein